MKKPLTLSVRKSSSFTFSLRYYKDIVNLLFWALWAFMATQTQSHTINLQKTLVFICRQKIYFTLPPAFRLITQEPAFCQIWDCGGISTISVFILDIFQKKTNHKIFQKISKTLFWDHFGPLLPKFRKKINIPEKKSCQFLDIPIIYHRAKNQKKLTNHF